MNDTFGGTRGNAVNALRGASEVDKINAVIRLCLVLPDDANEGQGAATVLGMYEAGAGNMFLGTEYKRKVISALQAESNKARLSCAMCDVRCAMMTIVITQNDDAGT